MVCEGETHHSLEQNELFWGGDKNIPIVLSVALQKVSPPPSQESGGKYLPASGGREQALLTE